MMVIQNTTEAVAHLPARLDVDNVSIQFGDLPVLTDVSFQVPHGGLVAVAGPNGAGKSTLFKALVGLIPVMKGQILIHGLPLGQHQDCVSYVPQREEVDWRFPVTVTDVVMMGRYGRRRGISRLGKTDREIVMHSLEQMAIDELAERPIGELSGGQQQRVFIARALAQQPHILLMDEPFAGVDMGTQEATLDLLDRLHGQQVTVLVSTHDLDLAVKRFEKILLLNRRVVAYGDSVGLLTPQVLREAFGGQILFVEGAAVVDQCCANANHEHYDTEKTK